MAAAAAGSTQPANSVSTPLQQAMNWALKTASNLITRAKDPVRIEAEVLRINNLFSTEITSCTEYLEKAKACLITGRVDQRKDYVEIKADKRSELLDSFHNCRKSIQTALNLQNAVQSLLFYTKNKETATALFNPNMTNLLKIQHEFAQVTAFVNRTVELSSEPPSLAAYALRKAEDISLGVFNELSTVTGNRIAAIAGLWITAKIATAIFSTKFVIGAYAVTALSLTYLKQNHLINLLNLAH
ncbi:MAG: hypothetical protein HZB76_02335 [Chlamydiae bacterium]|nr:hypothetical protein [Chlamydiota bacterium]